MFPVNLSAYDGEKLGVIISNPLGRTNMFTAVRTSDNHGVIQNKAMTVAIPQGNRGYEIFLKDHFPTWKAKFYKDNAAVYEAVANGEADCMLMSNYRLSRESDLLTKHKLTALATGQNMDMSFAIRRQDDHLYSILNKINHIYPETSDRKSVV